ncbi:hypothetical protein [Natrialba hulunbeirensis]
MVALKFAIDGREGVGFARKGVRLFERFEFVKIVDISPRTTEIPGNLDCSADVALWQPEVRRDVTDQVLVGDLLAVVLPDSHSSS